MTTEEEAKQDVQEFYFVEKKRRKTIYLLVLVVFLAAVFGFAFLKTEAGIQTIVEQYPQRLELRDDADAQNTAFSMQLLFDESSTILDEISFDFP